MPSGQYPYIDIAALDAVRARFAAGDAIAILTPALDEVIWANGRRRRSCSAMSDIDSIIGAEPQIGLRRQTADHGDVRLSAHRQGPRDHGQAGQRDDQPRSRVRRQRDRAARRRGRDPARRACRRRRRGAARPTSASRAIAGLDQAGQYAAIVDAGGGIVTPPPPVSSGSASAPRRSPSLSREARGDRLVKRMIAAGSAAPAGRFRAAHRRSGDASAGGDRRGAAGARRGRRREDAGGDVAGERRRRSRCRGRALDEPQAADAADAPSSEAGDAGRTTARPAAPAGETIGADADTPVEPDAAIAGTRRRRQANRASSSDRRSTDCRVDDARRSGRIEATAVLQTEDWHARGSCRRRPEPRARTSTTPEASRRSPSEAAAIASYDDRIGDRRDERQRRARRRRMRRRRRPAKLPREATGRQGRRPSRSRCRGIAAADRGRSLGSAGPLRLEDRCRRALQRDWSESSSAAVGAPAADVIGRSFREVAAKLRARSRRRNRRPARSARHLVGPHRALAGRRHRPADPGRPRRAPGLRSRPQVQRLSRFRRGARRPTPWSIRMPPGWPSSSAPHSADSSDAAPAERAGQRVDGDTAADRPAGRSVPGRSRRS